MSQMYFFPAQSVNATNPSVGNNGATAPSSSTEVAGINPSGNLQPLQTDAAGNLLVNIASGTGPDDINLATVGGVAISLGQKTEAASLPVTLASDEVVPISATALPLPAGASTSALQTSGNISLTSIDGKLATLGQKAMAGSTPVVIASDQSTVPVSIVSLPLPTGAATAANQVTGNASLASIDSKLTSPLAVTGPLTDAQLRASAVPVSATSLPSPSGRSRANAPSITDYTGVPVTSAAYVTIVASTAASINLIELFDSSGVAIRLAVGAAASEVDQCIIIPGGNGQVPLAIPAGSRISYKAVSTSATAGFNVLNMYS